MAIASVSMSVAIVILEKLVTPAFVVPWRPGGMSEAADVVVDERANSCEDSGTV